MTSHPERSARAAELWPCVVSALKEVVKDQRVTQDELHAAADFLRRTAEAGVMRSLVDVALAMTSLDATTPSSSATRSNPEGPYYRPDAPLRGDGRLFAQAPSAEAEELTVAGVIVEAATGGGIAGAEVDVWQADEHGAYDLSGFHLRGRVRTDESGRYAFTTVVPAEYTEHDDDPIGELFRILGRHNYRAGHIHLKVHVDGSERLTTQLFMADAVHLDSDYVEGAVSDDLIVQRDRAGNRSTASFDIRLAPLPAEILALV